jgi:hypothetical protein
MVSSLVGKVMWLGRATIFLVGLAVILALVLGVASRALGADGKPFLLGTINKATKVSTLIKGGVGPALELRVSSSNDPPLRVNSTAKVDNLNADLLDGKDVSALASTDEIMPKVLASDGQWSGLDADKLDGKDSGEFLGANQKALDAAHADQATNAQNADKLDGKDSTQFGPPDIFATVLADGTLWGPASTSQAASASRTSTGVYDVRFNQSVDQVGCVHLAQALDAVAFTQTIAGPRYGGPLTEVRVRQFDHAGNPMNGAVSLVVFCK